LVIVEVDPLDQQVDDVLLLPGEQAAPDFVECKSSALCNAAHRIADDFPLAALSGFQ